MIVRVSEVLKGLLRTLTNDVSKTFGVVIFRVKVSCIKSVDGVKLRFFFT